MRNRLPEGWNEEKLVNVVEVINDSVKEYLGERKYLSTGDLNFNVIDNLENVTYENKPSRANQNVKFNDVIFAKMKDTKKSLIINEDINDIIVSTGFFVLRTKNEMSSKYLYFYLNSCKFLSAKDNLCTGATQSALNLQGLSQIKIMVPTLDIQNQIVEVLEKSEKSIEKRKESIKLLDELIKSKFIEMFGDPVLNNKEWEKRQLEEYIDFLTSGSRGWASYFSDKGEMFLTIKNVKNNKIQIDNMQYVIAPNTQEATRTKVKEGDLLISITADLGRTGVVSKEIEEFGAYINQHLSLVRLDKKRVNPLFVSYFLESEGGKTQFNSKNQVGVKSGLNFAAIKSLYILVPPIEEQNKFIDFVKQVDKLKFEMEESLKELENNFNSLMQRAFKGELF